MGHGPVIPAYPVRSGVADIETECARMRAVFGIECGDIERFPGFVAWCNFTDPWGNRLGFSQDLVDGERMLPGGLEQGSFR